MGGLSETAMRRSARMADGWMPNFRPDAPDPKGAIDQVLNYAREYGRDPNSYGIQTSLTFDASREDWQAQVEKAPSWGATDLSINTMGTGLDGPRAHIARIEEIKAVIT
jgi:alkanesulfonate monooxygenase SsuD/methylene tetrahydromethanopterin reductase-like flavin-dependent oxidoreductase (luciferase family)